MLDKLAHSEDFSGEAELGLQLRPRLDGSLRIVRSVEVPCIESAKVLDRPQHLISAHCSRDISQVMRDRRMVYQRVSHHLEADWTGEEQEMTLEAMTR